MNNSRFLTVVFLLSILVAFFLGFFVGGIIRDADSGIEATEFPTPPADTDSPSDIPSEPPSNTPEPIAPEPVEPTGPVEEPVSEPPVENAALDLSTLKASLDSRFAGYASDWVVLVEDLKSGTQIISATNGLTEESTVTAASVIKLFIAGAVYDAAAKNGSEIDDTTEERLKSMISVSDNDSANKLISMLGGGDDDSGMAAVNAFIDSIGCKETRLNRLLLADGDENLVTAADCAAVLRMIYSGTYVSPQASEEILGMMKAQERRSKIPSGLVGFDGVSCANKTGELYAPDHDNTENDVAIVFTPNGDYILCILASKIINSADALTTFTEVSREVCAFYSASE